MSDHFIFARPVAITEERLREAAAKLAKQRAMKEALDRQIMETERQRAEARGLREGGERGSSPAAVTSSNARRRSSPRPYHQQEPASPSLKAHMKVPVSAPVQMAPGQSPVTPLTPANSHLEPARYTFTFEEGFGKFIRAGSGNAEVSSPPQLQQKAEVRGKLGSPRPNGAVIGGDGNALAPVKGALGARRGRSGARREVVARNGIMPTMSPQPQRNILGSPGTEGGIYETNSLPVDLAGILGGRRAPARPSGRDSSRTPTTAGEKYDAQSLPVDLIYQISASKDAHSLWQNNKNNYSGANNVSGGGGGGRGTAAPSMGAVPPLRKISETYSTGAGVTSPISLASAISGEDVYNHDCLPRDFNLQEELRRVQELASGHSPRSPIGTPRRLLSPRGGKGPVGSKQQHQQKGASPRGSAPRPAGNVLPPLERVRRVSDSPSVAVVELSFNSAGEHEELTPGRAPPRVAAGARAQSQQRAGVGKDGRPVQGGQQRQSAVQQPGQRAASRQPQPRQPGGNTAAVERLQKKLVTREVQMKRMLEKEKGWEEQVKQLKVELRNARKKERDLAKLPVDPHAAALAPPKRAETAPDQPKLAHQNSKKPHLQPLPGRKPDFSKARIFTADNFRPITAPDFPETTYTQDVFASANVDDNVGDDSLQLASLKTRQTALGLHQEAANEPVPIEYEHLMQFAEAQIISRQQADKLWLFFLARGGDTAEAFDQGDTEASIVIEEVPSLQQEQQKQKKKKGSARHKSTEKPMSSPTSPQTVSAHHREYGQEESFTSEADYAYEEDYSGMFENSAAVLITESIGGSGGATRNPAHPYHCAQQLQLVAPIGSGAIYFQGKGEEEDADYMYDQQPHTPVLAPALRRKISRYAEGLQVALDVGRNAAPAALDGKKEQRSDRSGDHTSQPSRSPSVGRSPRRFGDEEQTVSSSRSSHLSTGPAAPSEDQLMLLRKRHNLNSNNVPP